MSSVPLAVTPAISVFLLPTIFRCVPLRCSDRRLRLVVPAQAATGPFCHAKNGRRGRHVVAAGARSRGRAANAVYHAAAAGASPATASARENAVNAVQVLLKLWGADPYQRDVLRAVWCRAAVPTPRVPIQ